MRYDRSRDLFFEPPELTWEIFQLAAAPHNCLPFVRKPEVAHRQPFHQSRRNQNVDDRHVDDWMLVLSPLGVPQSDFPLRGPGCGCSYSQVEISRTGGDGVQIDRSGDFIVEFAGFDSASRYPYRRVKIHRGGRAGGGGHFPDGVERLSKGSRLLATLRLRHRRYFGRRGNGIITEIIQLIVHILDCVRQTILARRCVADDLRLLLIPNLSISSRRHWTLRPQPCHH